MRHRLAGTAWPTLTNEQRCVKPAGNVRLHRGSAHIVTDAEFFVARPYGPRSSMSERAPLPCRRQQHVFQPLAILAAPGVENGQQLPSSVPARPIRTNAKSCSVAQLGEPPRPSRERVPLHAYAWGSEGISTWLLAIGVQGTAQWVIRCRVRVAWRRWRFWTSRELRLRRHAAVPARQQVGLSAGCMPEHSTWLPAHLPLRHSRSAVIGAGCTASSSQHAAGD